MSTFFRAFYVVCCLCLLASPISTPVAAEVSCDKWNTSKFFAQADAATVSRCLNLGASANTRDGFNKTPLHFAAGHSENPTVIVTLLKAGADPNAKDKIDNRPLHAAAEKPKNAAIITTLLNAGADVHAESFQRVRPLHLAVYSENPENVTALVAAGADPNVELRISDNSIRMAPLKVAATKSNPALMAAFTEQAVAAFREKQRKAQAAARKQEVEEQLREVRISCDRWNTPGFFRHASTADVSSCLKTKNANAKDEQGRTPMHLAALHGKPAVVAALAKAGADTNAQDGKGRTPLHLVAVFGDKPEAVTALVKAGADLDAPDGKGRTPLQFAEKFSKRPTVVAALREARASLGKTRIMKVKSSCEKWNTPGFFKNVRPEDLSRCLKTKDPNARNEYGRTPMHYAAQGTSPAMVTALAKLGAKLNEPDGRGGWTPLHLAAWFSKTPSVMAALLAAGADPAARDKAGKTPWDYAERNAALKGTDVYRRLSEERLR